MFFGVSEKIVRNWVVGICGFCGGLVGYVMKYMLEVVRMLLGEI